MKSSLFMGDQCTRRSWVTHTHEFTSPRTYLQSPVLYLLNLSRLHYQGNYIPSNQENFCYPRTLIPTNKNDSTVNKNEKQKYFHWPMHLSSTFLHWQSSIQFSSDFLFDIKSNCLEKIKNMQFKEVNSIC